MSDASLDFLDTYNIKPVPAGPANPKGNGTIEGAFSQFKNVVGSIHIDTSSPEALAKSVLQLVVGVYIKMRNKLSLQRQVMPATGLFAGGIEYRTVLERKRESKSNRSPICFLAGLNKPLLPNQLSQTHKIFTPLK